MIRSFDALALRHVGTGDRRPISQNFAIFNSIIAVAVFVRLLGVINTLAMSVLERTRKIEVLRTLGSPTRLKPIEALGYE